MIKKFFLIIFSVLIFSSVHSQYKLTPAFPNLPAFSLPTEMLRAADGTDKLFLVQQRGLIYVFENNPEVSLRKVFINLTSRVSQNGFDHGLLGMAFHPDYENNHYFYVYYTFDSASATAPFWSRLTRYTADESNPDTAHLSSETIILTVPQPRPNHKGGKVDFGPDGYLYLSLGDGGNGGNPASNGQNKSTLLGKILRINVDSVSPGSNYSIPETNPFFGNQNGYKEEIYAYGLRNVWKFYFDDSSGVMWAGEVGQSAYEEINHITNGGNFGWSEYEGYHCYSNLNCTINDTDYIFPVLEYPHDTGAAITGGYIYKGSMFPELRGKYIFGDYVVGKIWALNYNGIDPPTYTQLLDTNFGISTFGIDRNNELYVCKYSSSAPIYKIYNPNVMTLKLKLFTEALYNSTSQSTNVTDTVKVILHPVSNPEITVDSAVIVLDSVNFSGIGFFYSAPDDDYYLEIRHRNALTTWSKSGGEFLGKGKVLEYDFTDGNNKAFGDNMIEVDTNRFGIYSGDINHDGVIDIGDLGILDNAVTQFVFGDFDLDLNGDKFIDISDMRYVENNSTFFVMESKP